MFPDFNSNDIRSKIVTSVAEEAVKINQNTRETADKVANLQNTVLSLQDDLSNANDRIEVNRIEAQKETEIADKKNWRNTLWLALATTIGGAVAGFLLSLLLGT